MISDPTYPLFSVTTFLGFFLCLIPLPWHLYSGNSGTCYYIMWASLACLNQFVNSIVWAGNADNVAPIWCEISIRIMLGASVGLPAASLCINRRLYSIASVRTVSTSSTEKRRAVLLDTVICVIFPLLFIALQYVVQGHRFNIFEDIGCYPALYNTLPTYFLSSMWPILIGLTSGVYCILSLRAFVARRAQFTQFLAASTSLTVSRYFRLMALAMTDILFTVPLSIFTIVLNATATPIGPWISWADTHFDYSRIEQIPALIWHQDRMLVIGIEFTRWTTPLCALIFFAYFGFAEEAKKNYKRVFSYVLTNFGRFQAKGNNLPSWSIRGPTKMKGSVPLDSITISHGSSPHLSEMKDMKRVTSLTTSSSRTLHLSVTNETSSELWTPKNDEFSPVSPLFEKKPCHFEV